METADERGRQGSARRRMSPLSQARGACARAGTPSRPQDHGSGDFEGSARSRAGKKTDLAVALAGVGRFPVKTVAETLEVARSNVIERQKGARPARGPQTRPGDMELAAEIRRLVDQRPTYGYRRIAALLKRERRSAGQEPVNAKRVYRLMKKHGLLLQRHTGRRTPREHDGQVIAIRSNIRWCSDALEFTCWNGEIVRVAFALDCHDREVIGWLATTAGISGEMIRDMMVQCVERRFAKRPRTAQGPMADGQRVDLRRPQDPRDRSGAQSRALLYARRKPRKQRHGRGLRQNLQARLRPRDSAARRRRGTRHDRKLDGGLQHRSPALAAGLPFTPRVHRYPIPTRRVSGLTGSTPLTIVECLWWHTTTG